MPYIGFSRPYAAVYNNNGGIISYTHGIRAGRGVSYEADIDVGDSNVFRADNQAAETVSGFFTGGKGTLTVAERDRAFELLSQGIKEREVEIEPGVIVKEIVYDDDAQPPNLGLGGIIKKMVNGNILWDVFIFTKQAFSPPSDSYTTQEEEFDWQTAEWESTIMRDDSPKHEWRVYARDLPTEMLADKYIRKKMGMPIEDIAKLAVATARGTQPGTTIVTVSPAKESDATYRYRLGANMQVPYYDQDVGIDEGFLAWDGSVEIDAGEAKQILLVEATADGYARKAGIAAILAADKTMSPADAIERLSKAAVKREATK